MNYFNPYFSYPYMNSESLSNGGLFSRLLGKGVNWSSILSGTQKTLNIVNQTIPLVKQISPVMSNAKTMFKIMNEFKKVDTPVDGSTSIQSNESDYDQEEFVSVDDSFENNGPTFFI